MSKGRRATKDISTRRAATGKNTILSRDLSPRAGPAASRLLPWRRLAVAFLLVPELIVFSEPVSPARFEGVSWQWWVPLVAGHRMMVAAFIAAALSAVLFSWDSLADEIRGTLEAPTKHDAIWPAWLGIHVTAVAALAVWGRLAVERGVLQTPDAGRMMLFAIVLTGVGLASWALAVMPPDFWFGWVRRSPAAIVAALIVGSIARVSEFLTMRLWSPLSHSTLFAVAFLLRIFGQQVVVQPDRAIVGTTRFSVEIAAGCSGLEGIALIVVLTGAYLWFFRSSLRFPQALLLFPVGVAAIGFVNVARITTLIMLGQWWPGAGTEGFHTVAGWLFFNATAFVLIIVSRRSSFINQSQASPADTRGANPAAVYLTPLLVMIASSMVTRIFSGGFDLLYPLRVLAVGGVIWIYRGEVTALAFKMSLRAFGLGAAAFALCILLATPRDPASYNAVFDASLGRMTGLAAAAWLTFRIAGALITVPIAEELAFRGYLLRKLVCANFETVSYRHFTLASFLGSSALFAVLHGQWPAGFVAGMIFAIAVYLSGRLCDAIVAHTTANALLVLWVLATHNWSLWS